MTEPIKIGMIMGKWVGGGVEAVIMNYYRHIDRSKIQFDFICDEDSTDIPYEEIEKLGGKVILCPPYQKIFKYTKELKKIFKENNYQIVHSNINALSVFPLRTAKKAKVSQKEAADVIAATIATIQTTVSKGKKVTLVGFGTFERRQRAARTGRNPQTGKEIKIAAKKVPAFSAGKKFKELVK